MTSIQGLLAFVATAKHASFARAARALELSPSAVARSVARLEAVLGVRLFHRTTRQVALTGDGRALFQRCQRLLEEIDALHSAAEGTRTVASGTLRIDVPVAYGKQVIVPVLATLAFAHPELALEVRFSDRFVDLIHDGLDAVVRVGALDDSRLVASRFDHQQLLVCASPRYLQRKGTPKTLADIHQHECLSHRTFATGGERIWQFRQGKKDVELLPQSRAVFDDGEAQAQGAIAGLGLVQLPNYFVEKPIREGKLVEVLARFRPRPMPISIVYPSRRQIPQRLRVLIDALAELRKTRSLDQG